MWCGDNENNNTIIANSFWHCKEHNAVSWIFVLWARKTMYGKLDRIIISLDLFRAFPLNKMKSHWKLLKDSKFNKINIHFTAEAFYERLKEKKSCCQYFTYTCSASSFLCCWRCCFFLHFSNGYLFIFKWFFCCCKKAINCYVRSQANMANRTSWESTQLREFKSK